MTVQPSYLLLQQEGFLIQSCLTLGLSHLRSANVSEKGNFYSASFQLSIGLERLMKAILIIDHMIKNNMSAPTIKEMKKKGHKLAVLFDAVGELQIHSGPNPVSSFPRTGTAFEILTLLGDFADNTRYFNLNSLSQSQTVDDPLLRWSIIYSKILTEDITEKKRERITQQSEMMAAMIGGLVSVFAHDLDQQPLNVQKMLASPQLQDAAAPHAVYYVTSVIHVLREVLNAISMGAYQVTAGGPAAIPDMGEFFHWLWMDRASILRKKRWP